MSSLESNIQGLVHAIEQGGIAKIIKFAAAFVLIIGFSLLYLIVEFKGISEPVAMDQAQIARNLARGQGFATNFIRPLALWQMQKNGREVPKVSVPDTYNAPLGPVFNAVLLKMVEKHWKMSTQQVIYTCDRVIAAGAIVCFLLAVGFVFLTAWRMFDLRLAILSSGLVIVCDMFWQFSLSGLPQMLMLLLFSAAMYCMVRAVQASYESTPVGLWLAGAGLLFGLLTLTHALAAWVFMGALLFTVLFFRPRFVAGLLLLGFFLLMVTPWLARNYAVSGSPFGIGIYSALDGVQQSETGWMRENAPSFNTVGPGAVRNEFQKRLQAQFNTLFASLGWSVVAPIFFVALLHGFRRKDASAVRWLLFSMWFFAVIGMVLFGMRGTSLGSNQLHVLFVPLMTMYGLAFLLVLWSRLPIDYTVVRIAFLSVLYLLCAIPAIIALLPGGAAKIHWPPYVPPFIAILGEWTEPREIIASDMPWAVAWYADRRSILLPRSPAELTRMHDYEILGGPINGLYLTPVTGNKPFFSDLVKGEYKEWASFILRSPSSPGFHLTAAVPLPVENECIFYSDRDRWSRGGIEVPEALKSEEEQEPAEASAP